MPRENLSCCRGPWDVQLAHSAGAATGRRGLPCHPRVVSKKLKTKFLLRDAVGRALARAGPMRSTGGAVAGDNGKLPLSLVERHSGIGWCKLYSLFAWLREMLVTQTSIEMRRVSPCTLYCGSCNTNFYLRLAGEI